jgi:hypothetical protein
VIVDRRHGPGGHWNDTYPFIRLHQPSAYYGVNSTPDQARQRRSPHFGVASEPTQVTSSISPRHLPAGPPSRSIVAAMGTAQTEFDTIADELYRLPPDEFTSARDASVSQARSAGKRALAAEIKALRRPTTSAWLANRLVRDRQDESYRLLSLGASMRDASQRLAGDELRRLSGQRHQVIAALTAAARSIASGAGIPFSPGVSSELEGTLTAALSDEEAAAALREGRLTIALRYTGFGSPTGLDEVEKSGRRSQAKRSVATPRRQPKPDRGPQAAERTDQLRGTRRTLKEAESALRASRKESDKSRRRADEARARRDQLRVRIHDLERQLDELRVEEADAALSAAATAEGRGLAKQVVIDAEQRAAEARRQLDALGK